MLSKLTESADTVRKHIKNLIDNSHSSQQDKEYISDKIESEMNTLRKEMNYEVELYLNIHEYE